MKSGDIRRVCVYCGSSRGHSPEYARIAADMGHLLAREGLGLVYGGAHVGLMGVMADAALAGGGKVIGVIPEALVRKEVAHWRLTELITVDNMHERKRTMADLADAFIAMPGGVGTMEELFETFSWLLLGFHSKPVGVLNACGYFDDLLKFLRRAVAEHFLKAEYLNRLAVSANPADLLRLLRERAAPQSDPWFEQRDRT
jgi:hypothetical protein